MDVPEYCILKGRLSSDELFLEHENSWCHDFGQQLYKIVACKSKHTIRPIRRLSAESADVSGNRAKAARRSACSFVIDAYVLISGLRASM